MQPENHWALKEWAVVCAALAAGRQSLLLRKGGIAEGPRGFEVEHPEFWLFPTRFHQTADELQSDAATLLVETAASAPPAGQWRLDLYARVRNVRHVDREEDLAAFVPHQILSAATVRERFHYRRPGLFALQLEVFRLPRPAWINDHADYAGCHSWVPLEQSLPTEGLLPVTTPVRDERELDSLFAVQTG